MAAADDGKDGTCGVPSALSTTGFPLVGSG
jgi:hypothetical protein